MPDFLNTPVVIAILQFVAGYFLKKYPNVPNQVIPVANYVLALIGYTIAPIPANAGFFDGLLGAGNVFLQSLIQTVAVTGLHSINKNTVTPLVLNAVAKLFEKKTA